MPAKLALAAALLLVLPRIAVAQSVPVYQMGTALQNDLAKYQRNGEVRNVGGIAGDNNGIGANPFSVTDYKQLGFCSNSAPTSGPYSAICIGHDIAGNGVLSLNSYGGEANHKLVVELNGTPIAVPGVAESPPCANILVYGAIPDGVTDTTAAFNAAKAASNCIAFPPGIFRFNSAITYALTADYKSVTIVGQGQDVTVLHFPNAVGTALAITKNKYNQSVHLRDFTMTTGTANLDIGIKVTQTLLTAAVEPTGYATNDITRVTLRSSQGYYGSGVTWNWKRGVNLIDESVWDLVGVSVYGALPGGGYAVDAGTSGDGIVIEGTTKGTGNKGVPVVFNISRANLNWLTNGLLIGNATQGFQISQSNFVGCFSGIAVPVGMSELDELAVSTSQFNNMNSINLGSTINLIALNGNIIYVPTGGHGFVAFAPLRAAQITGNTFLGATTQVGTGLRLDPSTADAAPAVVVGNSFYRLALGVKLQDAANGHLMSANMFYANLAGIDNTAPGTQNIFTGGTSNLQPAYADVGGAANNGAGLVRLTVNTTDRFYNGQMVLVGNVGGIPGIGAGQALVAPVRVVDLTHMDLATIGFSGAYTSGGKVTSLPP